MSAKASTRRDRKPYLDILRLAAAFLVIVNHTNSEVFRAAVPGEATWWLSLGWFFVSKTAVPLFVMISGALLLGREEDYKTLIVHRVLRILAALVLFSAVIYILDGGRSVGEFFAKLWQGDISTPMWYLYMYAALLLATPVLRKFVRLAKPKDYAYFIAVWAIFVCVIPAATALGAPPVSKYLAPPAVFAEWVGFMVLGYALSHAPERYFRRFGLGTLAWVCILLPLGLALWLTSREQFVHGALELRLERASLITTALPATAMFVLARRCFGDSRTPKGRPATFMSEVSPTAFGVYLVHVILIRYTRPMYVTASASIGRFPAMLCYELAIFVVCVAAVWVLRKIPVVKKLF